MFLASISSLGSKQSRMSPAQGISGTSVQYQPWPRSLCGPRTVTQGHSHK